MPRKLPPHVERNSVKGHTYLSFRIGKGPRVRLPADPTSEAWPAAQLDTLKKLRILIKHAIDRTDAEMAAFERRWPIGTKQRTAYALMLNAGTARVDVHRITWAQINDESVEYTRHKSKVPVQIGIAASLRKALDAAPREHITVINTEFGQPFTIDGFSGFMRGAMRAAGLPLDCKPHGLRKTLGRLLADAGASAHDIMAALGHTTLAQAEKYTREADRKRGAKRAVLKLNDHMANRIAQTRSDSLGKIAKKEG